MWKKVSDACRRSFYNAPGWFLKENGISLFQPADRDIDIPVLLKTNRFYKPARYSHCKKTKGASSENACTPPYLDHPTIFKNSEYSVIYYVYHTYDPFDHVKEAVSKWAEENRVKAYVVPNSWYNPECTLVALCSENDIIVGLDDLPLPLVEEMNLGGMKVYTVKEKEEMIHRNKNSVEYSPEELKEKLNCKLSEVSQIYRFMAACEFKKIAEIATQYSEVSEESIVTEKEIEKIEESLKIIKAQIKGSEMFERVAKGAKMP